ncbi:hypothetical protein DPMN_043758 [Dreissena polymorpha]|uniref:Uncharacterized protein n=1 Tax=Dreissena polymorpha TaxID=45954 RepID=A0A9D4D1Q2_DREPO|nr:hypothetical protein DPMN_043758 [Dreissena polymorpha]
MLGKCFRCRSSCDGPRISPLAPQYGCPRQSLSIITSRSESQQIEPRSYSIIPCTIIQATRACSKHSNFFKVNVPAARDTRSRARGDGDAGREARTSGDRREAYRKPVSEIQLRAF